MVSSVPSGFLVGVRRNHITDARTGDVEGRLLEWLRLRELGEYCFRCREKNQITAAFVVVPEGKGRAHWRGPLPTDRAF